MYKEEYPWDSGHLTFCSQPRSSTEFFYKDTTASAWIPSRTDTEACVGLCVRLPYLLVAAEFYWSCVARRVSGLHVLFPLNPVWIWLESCMGIVFGLTLARRGGRILCNIANAFEFLQRCLLAGNMLLALVLLEIESTRISKISDDLFSLSNWVVSESRG